MRELIIKCSYTAFCSTVTEVVKDLGMTELNGVEAPGGGYPYKNDGGARSTF